MSNKCSSCKNCKCKDKNKEEKKLSDKEISRIKEMDDYISNNYKKQH